MNPIELLIAERLEHSERIVPCGVFCCGKCKRVWGDRGGAERCCTCSFCGKELAKTDFSTSHSSCHKKSVLESYDKAVEKAVEVGADYDGFVYCERAGRDGFSESIEEMVDFWQDAIDDGDLEASDYPEFVLACKPNHHNLDGDRILEDLCEDGFEDMEDHVVIPDGFFEMIDKFNESNKGLVSWHPDYKRKVRMPPLNTEDRDLDKAFGEAMEKDD